ncbi:MAG: hypothetical protein IJ315_03170, partial [Firmicutes bacterium]|nr:hypothetical protein [Bacillota bacterium]
MNAKKKCKLIDIVRSGIFYTPFYPIAVLGWLLIPVRYFDWYSYKYPVIKNGFILLTIANMVLPIIIM